MATYYARDDGAAANLAGATDKNSPATSINIANLNADMGSLAANDEVVLSGLGGEFKSTLNIAASGLSGQPIIFRGEDAAVLNGAEIITGWDPTSGGGEVTVVERLVKDYVSFFCGYSTTGYKHSAEWLATETFEVSQIKIWLRRMGDLTGYNVWIEIWDDDGGAPGTLIANGTSSSIDSSTLNPNTSGAEETFVFPVKPTLTSGQTYYFVIGFDHPISTSNYIRWYGDSGGGSGMPRWRIQQSGATDQYVNDTMYIIVQKTQASLPNIWLRSGLTEDPLTNVYFDGVQGRKRTSIGELVQERDFYYDSGGQILYVFALSDPDTAYTSPGIEAAARWRGIEAVTQSYLEVKDLEFKYYKSDGMTFKELCSDVLVESCHIHDISYLEFGYYSGIEAYDTSNFTARKNIIHHCSWNGIDVQAGVGDNVQNVLYELNHIYSVGHNGADCKAIQGDVTGVIIRYNLIHNCFCNGVYGGNGQGDTVSVDDVEVYYNVIFENYEAGIHFSRLSGEDKFSDNIKVHNNIVYRNGSGNEPQSFGSDWGPGIVVSGTNLSVKNNITFENSFASIGSSEELEVSINGPSDRVTDNNVFDYCCCLNHRGPNSYSHYGTVTDFAGIQAAGYQANGLEENPGLFNPSAGEFWLTTNSPCIDVGENLGVTYLQALLSQSTWPDGVVTDSQDNWGSGWEMGAYLFDQGPAPPPVGDSKTFRGIPRSNAVRTDATPRRSSPIVRFGGHGLGPVKPPVNLLFEDLFNNPDGGVYPDLGPIIGTIASQATGLRTGRDTDGLLSIEAGLVTGFVDGDGQGQDIIHPADFHSRIQFTFNSTNFYLAYRRISATSIGIDIRFYGSDGRCRVGFTDGSYQTLYTEANVVQDGLDYVVDVIAVGTAVTMLINGVQFGTGTTHTLNVTQENGSVQQGNPLRLAAYPIAPASLPSVVIHGQSNSYDPGLAYEAVANPGQPVQFEPGDVMFWRVDNWLTFTALGSSQTAIGPNIVNGHPGFYLRSNDAIYREGGREKKLVGDIFSSRIFPTEFVLIYRSNNGVLALHDPQDTGLVLDVVEQDMHKNAGLVTLNYPKVATVSNGFMQMSEFKIGEMTAGTWPDFSNLLAEDANPASPNETFAVGGAFHSGRATFNPDASLSFELLKIRNIDNNNRVTIFHSTGQTNLQVDERIAGTPTPLADVAGVFTASVPTIVDWFIDPDGKLSVFADKVLVVDAVQLSASLETADDVRTDVTGSSVFTDLMVNTYPNLGICHDRLICPQYLETMTQPDNFRFVARNIQKVDLTSHSYIYLSEIDADNRLEVMFNSDQTNLFLRSRDGGSTSAHISNVAYVDGEDLDVVVIGTQAYMYLTDAAGNNRLGGTGTLPKAYVGGQVRNLISPELRVTFDAFEMWPANPLGVPG